jgi:hypothetical protein
MGAMGNSKLHNLGFLYLDTIINKTFYANLLSGCQMTWNYFSIGHSKGRRMEQ